MAITTTVTDPEDEDGNKLSTPLRTVVLRSHSADNTEPDSWEWPSNEGMADMAEGDIAHEAVMTTGIAIATTHTIRITATDALSVFLPLVTPSPLLRPVSRETQRLLMVSMILRFVCFT